jgi:hypothetical protein
MSEINQTIKDSGQRQDFSTGAVRDTQTGKPRPDLIPPAVQLFLGAHFGAGADKYGERNFEKGIPLMRTMASIERHLFWHKCGVTDENHLAAMLWNAVVYTWTYLAIKSGLLPKELDDRPESMKEGNPLGQYLFGMYVEEKKSKCKLNWVLVDKKKATRSVRSYLDTAPWEPYAAAIYSKALISAESPHGKGLWLVCEDGEKTRVALVYQGVVRVESISSVREDMMDFVGFTEERFEDLEQLNRKEKGNA